LGNKDISEKKDRVLITTGIYARTRNPIWLGDIFGSVAIMFFTRSLLGPIGILLTIIYFYKIAKQEEENLERAFGEEYKNYKREMPMFIPRLKRRRSK